MGSPTDMAATPDPDEASVLVSPAQPLDGAKAPDPGQAPANTEGAKAASKSKPVTGTMPTPNTTSLNLNNIASAVAACKLGLPDQLKAAVDACDAVVSARDPDGRTCLHYAAGCGQDECVEVLLTRNADPRARDLEGNVPLHLAASHGQPMCAYNIAKACPLSCLARNLRKQTPVDLAAACERGEVLNAMLLACAGEASDSAVKAMKRLLEQGAVPDTWAPNGSSALMLAAAANGTSALRVLLSSGATLELQDALGRSALMFAAGNCAMDTTIALLDAGGCLAQRDRRGRSVLDYAPEDSEVRRMLRERLDALEAVANKRQADLLASLDEERPPSAQQQQQAGQAASKGGKKRKKKSKGVTKAAARPVPVKSPTPSSSGEGQGNGGEDSEGLTCEDCPPFSPQQNGVIAHEQAAGIAAVECSSKDGAVGILGVSDARSREESAATGMGEDGSLSDDEGGIEEEAEPMKDWQTVVGPRGKGKQKREEPSAGFSLPLVSVGLPPPPPPPPAAGGRTSKPRLVPASLAALPPVAPLTPPHPHDAPGSRGALHLSHRRCGSGHSLSSLGSAESYITKDSDCHSLLSTMSMDTVASSYGANGATGAGLIGVHKGQQQRMPPTLAHFLRGVMGGSPCPTPTRRSSIGASVGPSPLHGTSVGAVAGAEVAGFANGHSVSTASGKGVGEPIVQSSGDGAAPPCFKAALLGAASAAAVGSVATTPAQTIGMATSPSGPLPGLATGQGSSGLEAASQVLAGAAAAQCSAAPAPVAALGSSAQVNGVQLSAAASAAGLKGVSNGTDFEGSHCPCCSGNAAGDSLAQQLQAARAEAEALRAQLRREAVSHERELASILDDAAQHEAKVVDAAVMAERMRVVSLLNAWGMPQTLVMQMVHSWSLQADTVAAGMDGGGSRSGSGSASSGTSLWGRNLSGGSGSGRGLAAAFGVPDAAVAALGLARLSSTDPQAAAAVAQASPMQATTATPSTRVRTSSDGCDGRRSTQPSVAVPVAGLSARLDPELREFDSKLGCSPEVGRQLPAIGPGTKRVPAGSAPASASLAHVSSSPHAVDPSSYSASFPGLLGMPGLRLLECCLDLDLRSEYKDNRCAFVAPPRSDGSGSSGGEGPSSFSSRSSPSMRSSTGDVDIGGGASPSACLMTDFVSGGHIDLRSIPSVELQAA